jgi:hypothetical protein
MLRIISMQLYNLLVLYMLYYCLELNFRYCLIYIWYVSTVHDHHQVGINLDKIVVFETVITMCKTDNFNATGCLSATCNLYCYN